MAESSEGEARLLRERQQLLSEVLSAVKSVQSRYGGKSELATEDEPSVKHLCKALQDILQHGITVKGHHVLRNALTNVFNSTGSPTVSNAPPFWNYVKNKLSRHELERYMILKHVTTDYGRGRAWLRSALNEHSLEKFMEALTNDLKLASTYYDPGAFLLDYERSTMLPQIASGVGTILFALKIDNSDLDNMEQQVAVTEQEIVADEDKDFSTTSSTGATSKKRKKVPRQVVLFNDDDSMSAAATNELRFDEKIDISVKNQQTLSESNFERLKAKLHSSQLQIKGQQQQQQQHQHQKGAMSSSSIDEEQLEEEAEDGTGSSSGNGIYSNDDMISIGELSIDSPSIDNNNGLVCGLTPMKDDSCLGPLIPVAYTGDGGSGAVNSSDSASLAEPDEIDYADYAVTAATSETVTRAPSIAPSADSSLTTISREELKGALLSVMSRKDELADQVSHLKTLLEKEAERNSSLSSELTEVRKKSTETNDKAQARIQTLTRENDLLKHQLKKYVSAVMKLRDGPQAYETLAKLEGRNNKTVSPSQGGSSGQEDSSVHNIAYVDYHYEASEFEKKLIQVAEMHGELLEFNEHLQKSIKLKDCVIKRLHEELVDLRGPLPDDSGEGGSVGNPEAAESATGADIPDDVRSIVSLESTTTAARGPLINIWVPSVFMSGSGQNTHHVYQVYLRIREEEWNIYRRYSEFYAFHKDLLKRDEALVKHFDFPPKKSVGYKASAVVEDRRKRLQAYLRKIVNLMVQTNPSLAVKPDKEHVVLLMPFLGDNMRQQMSSSSRQAPRVTNARKSLFHRRSEGGRRPEPVPQLAL